MSATILVISSRPEEAQSIRGPLGEEFQLELEHEAEAGWHRLAEERFDGVLLEDGLLETRRVLRRLEETNLGCFLILYGDRQGPERVLAAVMAGAYTYLLRPLSGPKVRAALRRGLRNRKKLLGIVAMAADLREANQKLTQQKRRLQEEKRQLAAKSRQLNLINELSHAASSTLEPGRVISAVGARLCRGLPLRAWAVLFAPPGSERAILFVPGRLGRAETAAVGRSLMARFGRVGGRAHDYEVCHLGRRVVDQEVAASLASEEGLILPLLAAGQPIGLYKLLPAAAPSAELVRFAESAANMVALGLKNAGELMVARRLADHDALTRIANRRAFERQLRREFNRSRRYRQPLTLVMADIDHFKRVNDRYGHQVGDLVLREVARLLSEAVRHCDFVARYGGEEFALILPYTGLESAVALADRIKCRFESRPLAAGQRRLGLTLSLGLADTAAPGADEAPDLIRLADRALYMSKMSGRNCVSTWKDIVGTETPLFCTGPTPRCRWQQPGEAT